MLRVYKYMLKDLLYIINGPMLETVMHRLKAQQITRPIKMEYIQLRGIMTTVPY
jgi:hypothetical protein